MLVEIGSVVPEKAKNVQKFTTYHNGGKQSDSGDLNNPFIKLNLELIF
jgi:hypothetical protein